MQVSREKKEQLNALSKEIFGSSSRWVKLVDKGHTELVTEEVEEVIPADENGENGGIDMVKKPVLTASGAHQYVTKRYTVEEIEAKMNEIKTQRDVYVARLKTMQEEQRKAQEAAEVAKKVHADASGSASL